MPPVPLLTWLWQNLQDVPTCTRLPVTLSVGFAGCQALSRCWEAPTRELVRWSEPRPEAWTLADKCPLAGGSEGHSQDPSSELWLPWVTCPSAHPSLASRPHAYRFPESPPT